MTTLFEERDPTSILAVLDLAQVMVRDLDGRIIRWTTGAQRLYGWTAQEAIGQISHELLATGFPKPRAEIEAELLANGQWHGALQHRTQRGQTIRVVSHWALQRDVSGQPAAIAEVNTDLGPQQQAEEARIRLAAIVASSRDAIIGKTLDGRITDWNAAAEALFGYTAAEIVGQPIRVLFPPEHVEDEEPILARVKRGERIETFDTVRRRKDGVDVPVAVTISPIVDAAGRIVGASTIMRDLTERVERDRRLAELQAELLHVSRLSELGQLVAALVHEVNQPLTAIGNYIGGLRRLMARGAYEPVPLVLQKLSEQNDRTGAIIHRLREFVRKGAPTTQREDLSGIVTEAIELVSISPAAKGVAIKTDLADDNASVMVDRVQIQQVLFNLMRNSMEAMQGRPHRVLTVASRPEVAGMVEVSVADTGPGLPEEVQGKLFQPFVTTKSNGMGMGLSICRSIVEGHGGRLAVERRSGQGTVFRFTLRSDIRDRAGTDDRPSYS